MVRKRDRGEAAIFVLYIAGFGIAWYVFFFVKDWIYETKERRAGRGLEEEQPPPVKSREESGSFVIRMRY